MDNTNANTNANANANNSYKHPITSYGIILFRKKCDEYQYLMLRRKNTFGFIDFIKGQYCDTNTSYIQQLFNEMSVHEKELIRQADNFDVLWKVMWDDCKSKTNMKNTSKQKFNMLKENGIIEQVIQNSNTNWHETEWEFPKGRKNYLERELDCSLREFEEETGLAKCHISTVDNLLPIEELFLGTDNKYYKNKYFLACVNNDDDKFETLNNFQLSEVSKLEWKNVDSCLESIRPYNFEKKILIQNINELICHYQII